MKDREEDIPLWRFVREVWDEQTKNGRLVMTENPWQSEALHLDFMEARPQLHRAKVPQCAFGLKDVISEKPHQKYTALDSNDYYMCEGLMIGATCNHDPGEHQPIEGSVFFQGRSQRRSALAARWPIELCEHILEAAEYAWEKCEDEAPRKLAEGRPPNALHYALPVEPLPTARGRAEKAVGEGRLERWSIRLCVLRGQCKARAIQSETGPSSPSCGPGAPFSRSTSTNATSQWMWASRSENC